MHRIILFPRFLLVAARLVLPGGAAEQPATVWPVVASIDESRAFNDFDKPSDSPYVVSVKDVNGAAAYELECRSADRTLRCALFAAGADRNTSANLLEDGPAAAQRTDWLDRGRVVGKHLREPCSLSSYGTDRVFRLRGMRMNLRFSDVKWSDAREPALTAFTLHVSVAPERGAVTPISETVTIPKWLMENCL